MSVTVVEDELAPEIGLPREAHGEGLPPVLESQVSQVMQCELTLLFRRLALTNEERSVIEEAVQRVCQLVVLDPVAKWRGDSGLVEELLCE
ncbi:hypothetical protein EV641_10658 [Rhodococcus sp. SMB37]|uniref:hypothetical protein n=1 Tax=Rhodococcus sp. SMB37 TaxID=2512213 RepID=UPI0010450949|nr:hypothetical protein [Rhodococcus sp. SMB37]TCN53414.1 hypothetical protein EV641_10658 [Rhodococcus sp. SMB37]